MKTKLLQTLLLLFGITAVHGQVNLSGMPNESTDSLQKSRIRYFSPGKGGKGRVCSPVNWAPGSQQAGQGYSTQID